MDPLPLPQRSLMPMRRGRRACTGPTPRHKGAGRPIGMDRMEGTGPVSVSWHASRKVERPAAGPAQGPAGEVAALCPWLAPPLARALSGLAPGLAAQVEEVRRRAGAPLEVVTAAGGVVLTPDGRPAPAESEALIVTADLLERTWQIACEASVYSRVDETRHGYLTLPGGHRVGVAGRVLVENGRVLRLRDVGGLAFRLARERPGCAGPVLPAVWDREAG